jgi:hypothetical protein
MAEFGWLPAPKLREYYVDPAVGGGQEAQRVLYLTVVTGQVRARLNGRILRLDQIALMGQINPFSLPPDLELSIEDARRKWGRALIGGADSSGSLAMLAAMRRASSRVSSLAAARLF